MSDNVAGYNMPTLTVFKMELQRITDMNLEINPEITDYMQSRINAIENNDENKPYQRPDLIDIDPDKREWMYDGNGNKVYKNNYTNAWHDWFKTPPPPKLRRL